MSVFHHMQRSEFFLPDAPRHYAPNLQIEPIHLDLYIRPDIKSKNIDVRLYHRVKANVDGVRSLQFNAIDFDIVCIKVVSENDQEHIMEWDYDDKIIDIEFGWEIKKDEEITIELIYQVSNPIGGLFFGGPTPEVPNRGLWMCSDHETQRARYWLACFDHSNVRTTVDVYITHQKEHTALGPGLLVEEIDSTIEGYRTTHWSLQQPCPSYLLCIAVGDFVKWDGGSYKGKPIAAFAPKPITEADLERNFKPTADMIALLSDILTELPWDKYYQLAFPGIGGAMENISLVTWDEYWIFDDVMHADLGVLVDQINLHELAHTWFGDLIVCRDYAHVWLKESWATYMEVVWKERTKSVDDYHMELLSQRRRYFGEVKTRYSRPIQTRKFDTPWQMYDAHLYPGGSVRLHMLRKKMGDDLFWKGVQLYINRYTHKVVESVDFRKCMEEVSHLSLAHYFEQWFETAGYPNLRVESKYNKKNQCLEIKCKQSIIGGEKDAAMFQFELEFAVEMEDGTWRDCSMEISKEHNRFVLKMPAEPKQIVIDPYCRSVVQIDIHFPASYYTRTLESCPYIYGRIQVAETLVALGKPKMIQKIYQYLVDEPHPEARVMVLRSCKKKVLAHVRDMLLNLLELETHPWVVMTILEILGHHVHPDSSEAIIEQLQKTNSQTPYRVTTAALMALANQKEHTDLDIITDFLEDEGWYRYVQRGAVQALGAVQTEEAALCLIEILQANESYAPQVYRAALMALANCVKWLPESVQRRAVLAILPYLEYTMTNVRLTAVHALAQLPTTQYISRLESAKILFCEQDQPTINRSIMAIRNKKPSDGINQLRKRIEKLELKLSKVLSILDDE